MHSGESTEKQGNAEPTSPADEIHDLETEEIKDPSEAEVIEPIAGVKDMEGKQVLEALAEYGFSVDEGLEAPDGTRSWTLQSGDYFCDMQADVNGNIYNAVFNTTSENYEAFLSDCAGVFSKDAKSWVVENVNKDAETEIEEFVVSISEGPGGYSLQVCSKDYRETVVGPQQIGGRGRVIIHRLQISSILMYSWNSNYLMYLDSSKCFNQTPEGKSAFFVASLIDFDRTGIGFCNLEHFYVLMNNSG